MSADTIASSSQCEDHYKCRQFNNLISCDHIFTKIIQYMSPLILQTLMYLECCSNVKLEVSIHVLHAPIVGELAGRQPFLWKLEQTVGGRDVLGSIWWNKVVLLFIRFMNAISSKETNMTVELTVQTLKEKPNYPWHWHVWDSDFHRITLEFSCVTTSGSNLANLDSKKVDCVVLGLIIFTAGLVTFTTYKSITEHKKAKGLLTNSLFNFWISNGNVARFDQSWCAESSLLC